MFNKKTIALLEREIDKADGKIKELERGIEFRDGQIKRLVRQIAKRDEKQKELAAENKKLWDMYTASERVRKKLAGDNPSVSCADSSLYTREPMEGDQGAQTYTGAGDVTPYITVTVPKGERQWSSKK